MKHLAILSLVASLACATMGCAVSGGNQNAMSQMMAMFRPNPIDGPLTPEDAEDDWGFVGKEGRADQDRERDPDRWWQNLVMSPEARNIERNLGID